MMDSTHLMVQKLDQPFKDMREVLLQITETLSEMELNDSEKAGTPNYKGRMSVAH